MEEIEKLRAKVEKDPNSRLFLPLAEEYRKSGMLDDAISMILRGLERQPGYTSARVALGRIYLEKNMIEEAKNEFEAVVRAIPDNLFAHKKLADIYRDSGETAKAIAEYETVIKLNPLDDDAKSFLSEIGESASEEEELPVLGEIMGSPLTAEQEDAEETAVAIPEEFAEKVAADSEEEFTEGLQEFEGSLSVIGAEEVEGTEDVQEIPEGQIFEVSEESPFESIFAASESGSEEEPAFSETAALSEDAGDSGGVPGLSAADPFIAAGNYYRALETYKEILARDPDDRHILQRIVELRALMKLTGKDGETLIAGLEAFLDAVKRGFPKGP
jgi:tetratricopeptide (TPR) repeat protein